ncbi:hypothetical protein EDC01DRAFT_657368 [Geopyxis carbonaria]|nr:hypothetical protein EDC01DRAFT_657368 [Geopyxis carbonaria]
MSPVPYLVIKLILIVCKVLGQNVSGTFGFYRKISENQRFSVLIKVGAALFKKIHTFCAVSSIYEHYSMERI